MCFFFFNDTATTEIYTLSLHDALPICLDGDGEGGLERGLVLGRLELEAHLVAALGGQREADQPAPLLGHEVDGVRSEEHTSELQSRQYLVCRLLLEKKNNHKPRHSRAS